MAIDNMCPSVREFRKSRLSRPGLYTTSKYFVLGFVPDPAKHLFPESLLRYEGVLAM